MPSADLYLGGILWEPFKGPKRVCIGPKNMKKIGSELTGKFLQNVFFHSGTYFFELGFRIYIQNPATMLIFSQNGLWSVPNKQNPSFYSIFHAFSRPKFPPVWPGPIPGPYQPFPGIIPPYRPSIPPTSSSQLGPPKFLRNFPPV